jgi:hypothetical protein
MSRLAIDMFRHEEACAKMLLRGDDNYPGPVQTKNVTQYKQKMYPGPVKICSPIYKLTTLSYENMVIRRRIFGLVDQGCVHTFSRQTCCSFDIDLPACEECLGTCLTGSRVVVILSFKGSFFTFVIS